MRQNYNELIQPSLTQPTSLWKNGQAIPEMDVRAKVEKNTLSSRNSMSGWRDKTKNQDIITYLKY